MTSRVSYNTLGLSKSNPGDLFSFNFANLSIISSTVNSTPLILLCPDLSVILDGRGSKSLPSPSFHFRSPIFTVVFLLIYCKNFFGFSLHSRDILSCSCCTGLTISLLTLLRTTLYFLKISSSLEFIQRFHNWCFFRMKARNCAMKGWKFLCVPVLLGLPLGIYLSYHLP